LVMIGGLELDGRDVVEGAVKPLGVELMWVIVSSAVAGEGE